MAENVAEPLISPIEVFKNSFNQGMINIIIALLIFLIGFILGKLTGKITKKILHHINLDYFLRKTFGIKLSVEDIVSGVLSYFIYIVSFIMSLNHIGLSTAILQMIIGGLIVIIVISIILSVKDFIPNLVAGLILREKEFIKEDDIIRIKDIEGKIEELGFIETIVINKKGDRIFIPNVIFTKNEVINFKPKSNK